MQSKDALPQSELLAAALRGEQSAFASIVTQHRNELYAHCYRMLGSLQDAEDALQESLLAAWRGLDTLENPAALRAWLYRISTHTCLRSIARMPRRIRSADHGPPRENTRELGELMTEPIWLEPFPSQELETELTAQGSDPSARYLELEGIELAFVAAVQHLPGTQRAALLLREVLEYSAEEAAQILDTSVASLNSALQRARKTIESRSSGPSQQAELNALGVEGQRQLVRAFVSAWERADVPALMSLIAADARFTMPPLPAWFDGAENVRRFLVERVFENAWRLVPLRANGQLGFACYMRAPGDTSFRLGAINLLCLRAGQITEIAAFLDPALHAHFGLPDAPP